jgi:aminoglycoside phosphotransferase (APT) family kinase protein
VSVSDLLDSAVERTPLRQTSQGYSGATLERIVLADSRVLIVKRISPAWDVMMRLTHDTGRAAWLWTSGLMNRFPPVIDHAIVAAEPTEDGWVIVMRDVSGALLPDDRLLTRAESRRILQAASALHHTFRNQRIEGLCSIADHLAVFSPQTAARERGGSSQVFEWIERGWELFPAVVPRDVAEAVHTIHKQPERLAAELDQCEPTLIHGDLWLANVGFRPDRIAILDWGAATQAPPAFEFTTYLTGAWSRVMATREALIDDFRDACGDFYDDRALQLSVIATFAEYGWNKALDAAEHPDAAKRSREAADLAWWTSRVRHALETTWSPH